MAMIRHVVQVVGGTIRNDLWCDECNTSGRFEIDMHAMSNRGLQSIGMINQCVRCDYAEPAVTEAEPDPSS
jgi:hypothetical protein